MKEAKNILACHINLIHIAPYPPYSEETRCYHSSLAIVSHPNPSDFLALGCLSRSSAVSNKLGTLTPEWSKGTLFNAILATAFAARNEKAMPPPLNPARIHWDCLPGTLPICGSPSGVTPWTTVALSVSAFKSGMRESTYSRSRCSQRLCRCPSSP